MITVDPNTKVVLNNKKVIKGSPFKTQYEAVAAAVRVAHRTKCKKIKFLGGDFILPHRKPPIKITQNLILSGVRKKAKDHEGAYWYYTKLLTSKNQKNYWFCAANKSHVVLRNFVFGFMEHRAFSELPRLLYPEDLGWVPRTNT